MARLAAVLVLVLFMSVAAGCVEDSRKTATSAPPTTATVTEQTGGIEGFVTNDEVVPIKDANVVLGQANATFKTGPDGAFAFSELDPGSYTLVVGRVGYYQKTAKVLVRSGLIEYVNITLIQVPPSIVPVKVVQNFNGSMLVGTAAQEGDGVLGEPIDEVEFPFSIPKATPEGAPLTAETIVIDLTTDSPTAVDLDLYLVDSKGEALGRSTSPEANEKIERFEPTPPGEYVIRVVFWAGAGADFNVVATVDYLKGIPYETFVKTQE